ncbi:MAG: hypothetical protein L3K26_01625, partial [Candidatus Hydrogenedentes bacterium]|nr:hypothetical protein [Candidatus Hydrogenedentota bacterium]
MLVPGAAGNKVWKSEAESVRSATVEEANRFGTGMVVIPWNWMNKVGVDMDAYTAAYAEAGYRDADAPILAEVVRQCDLT